MSRHQLVFPLGTIANCLIACGRVRKKIERRVAKSSMPNSSGMLMLQRRLSLFSIKEDMRNELGDYFHDDVADTLAEAIWLATVDFTEQR